MRLRLQAWWEETHRAGFELVRHFLARSFDSDLATASSGWQKLAIGLLAALLSLGILGLNLYWHRYNWFESPAFSSAQVHHNWVRADLLSFIAAAMALTALFTLLLWQRLFPTARDCLTLASLPVSAREIFQAKFASLLLLFVTYVLALTLLPSVLFAVVTSGRWQENPSTLAIIAANFCATAGACGFVFFTLLALQGLLLNVLPGRVLARVSLIVQGTLLVATLGALPLVGRQPADAAWWPPVWFLRLWEAIVTGPGSSARAALLAVAMPPFLSILAYLVSYHRYRRLLLEAPRSRGGGRASIGSWLIERFLDDPRRQAAFAFIGKTLARSRGHLLILLACGGLALGWITNVVLDTPRPTLRDQGMYGLLVVLVPLALAMLAALGLRYVFSLPVTPGANWVFQTLDRDGHAAWLAAVERFVVCCGLAPILLASLPAAIAILGGRRAAAASVLTFLAALLWFEALFRRWRKLPFTCSYLPGKQPLCFTLFRYGLVVGLLGPACKLILASSGDLAGFVALFTLLAALWWRLRASRRAFWSQCALCYEEQPEAVVITLDLQPGAGEEACATGGTGLHPTAGETACATGRSGLQPVEDIFSGALVDSRGRLPAAWAEEIEEDRRHPMRLLGTFLEDIRYGWRLIRRNPLFSAVVVLTLTVGIGINASVFTVVNGFAFRPRVQRDPARFLRVVPATRLQNTIRRASYAEYILFRDHSRSLRQLAAYAHFPAFIGEDHSAGSVGVAVSCNFFLVDGLDRATVGRLLTEEDCHTPGRASIAVISEALWRARFASDPRVIGRVVEVNNRPLTVVGVVPDRTAAWSRTGGWSGPASVWLPYTAQTHFELGNPFAEEHLWLSLAGRLAPGFSRSQARTELTMLARQQDRLHRGRDTAIVTTDGSWIQELELTLTGRELMLMALFVGAFNLVLLISCANVATLLLARAAGRKSEIAVRLSLGAPRIRLVRMLVTESLLLAAVAGAASLCLAWRGPEPLFRLVVGRAPDFPLPPDWRTFAYVAGVVLLTGVLAGLAPALESLKVDLTGSLKGGGVSRAGGARRLEGHLVSAQVAMSMVLLVGAALLAQAEDRALRGDPGYLPHKVVVAPLFFPDNTPRQTAAMRLLSIAERVKALPGVRSVALSEGMPIVDHVTLELRPPARPDASQPVDIYTASPGFFETLGIPIQRGREFKLWETSSVIVSQRLARSFWPRQNPIGQVLTFPGGVATVVGVARDVDPLRLGGSENPALYRPWRLHPIRNVMSVRFDAGAATGAAAVRAAVRETDPNLLVMARLAQTWIDLLTQALWNVVALIVILGVAATLLATAGIYGAVSFAVSRRTRELGLRMALGAGRLEIIRQVFLAGGRPVVQGLLAGLWLSVAAAAALQRSFQGTPLRLDTANPLLYCAAALLLLTAAALAMLAPARRAARSDPLAALRCE